MDRGLATELLLRKDGDKVGYIEDTKTCVGMEVRGCTGGGQSWKRAVCSTGLAQSQACSGCYKQWEAEFGVRFTCVRMRCKDLGEDGQLCVVLLGWAALLSWHNLGQIVSGGWSSRQQQDACGGTESCGEDCIRLCVLCTQSALGRTGFRRHRRRDRLAVDVGDQDSRGHRRARAKYLKTENVWGVEEYAATKVSFSFNTSSYYLDIAIVCCWAVCGLSTCAILGRGRHGRIRRQSDLTWVCWWRQVTEEEVHLCRAVTVGHNFFFSALWGKATSR